MPIVSSISIAFKEVIENSNQTRYRFFDTFPISRPQAAFSVIVILIDFRILNKVL